MRRRACLGTFATLAAWPGLANAAGAAAAAPAGVAGLRFPRDFGSHPDSRTEWWYLTGALATPDGAEFGFQVTFFRSATGLAAASTSRFAATQLVFAHAALTDLRGARLLHDQRIARAGFEIADAALPDTDVVLRDWSLRRESAGAGSRYRAAVTSARAGYALALQAQSNAAPLLQGEAGLSRKGPAPDDTSRYYSEPQLATRGTLTLAGRALPVSGRAWLDHEWSDAFLPAGAVGWDWIGINLADGGALTAFRLRRADGSALYAGGSWRDSAGALRVFGPDEVSFAPGRVWRSPATQARYPVEWSLRTPLGRHAVRARLDAQELDGVGGSGAIYWEGLSELLDESGRRVGTGYLEMTGYAGTLKL